MVLKNFRISVMLRVLLIAAVLFAAVWLWIRNGQEYLLSAALLFMVAIFTVVSLIRYVERTNHQLTRFLDSIRYSDFSVNFRERGTGESFESLQKAFTNVAEAFRQERAERQESYQTLQTVIQHVGIGLLAFNREGNIILLNTASKRMLGLPALHSIGELEPVNKVLHDALLVLNGGDRTLLRFSENGNPVQWVVYATEFVIRGDTIKLISLQNISRELEEKEMEAWQDLTRILAHEIMNSITPISSLSGTVHSIVGSRVQSVGEEYVLDRETLDDVREALATISTRSQGLMRFVQSYRDFTRIPGPEPERIRIGGLLDRVKKLMKGEFEKQAVEVLIRVEPETLEVVADPQLIEQVLINLTRNALSAIQETDDPRLEYRANLDSNGRIRIDVADNGTGIRKEVLEKIFIPFYTAAGSGRVRGSGIGLSLSRQIMRLHKGTLTVTSDPDRETVFTLRF